jgi:hypothetical protein
MSAHLDRLARRVESDPFFLAAPLARYAASNRLDEDALAERLGCDRASLTHLRLCRSPEPMPPQFFKDVQQIAARFALDPDRLAEIVRFGQALLAVSPPASEVLDDAPGYLMAARDEESEEQPPGGGSS